MPPIGDDTSLTRLATAVRVRRGELGLSVDEAARRGGISSVTWTRVERATPVRTVSYRGIERALRWASGGADAVMSGVDPAIAEDPSAPVLPIPPVGSPERTMVEIIWNSDLAIEIKVELIDDLRSEQLAAERRAMQRLAEALKGRSAS